MSSISFPLQGFFNFLIFIRPRYITARRRHPDKTRIGTLLHAIWYPTGQKDHHQERSPSVICERLVRLFSRTKPLNNTESDLGNIVAMNSEESANGETNGVVPIQDQHSFVPVCDKDFRDMDQLNENRSMSASVSPIDGDDDDDDVDDDGDNNNNKTMVDINGGAKKKDFFWESGHFDVETRSEANDDVDNKNDATWIVFR
jgi:hypothetical protein